jgi:hypothetical protein
MSLGLSHSLSRYKLKFSPEKVDTMIVQVRGSFVQASFFLLENAVASHLLLATALLDSPAEGLPQSPCLF